MNTIVIGTNHNNTLGLIWSLGEAGHKVFLLLYKGENNYVATSKYITKTYFITHDDNIIEIIKSISASLDSKPMVFVSNDHDAAMINDYYSDLAPYAFFESAKNGGSVNKYRDKDIGNQLAEQCGFTLPKNHVIKTIEQFTEVDFSYPIVIKANNSIHGGKVAMKKCETEQDASDFLKAMPHDYFPLQVQEFIEKEYEIMLLGCSLEGGNNLICPVANRKIRQYPRPMGLGSYSESLAVRHQEALSGLKSKIAKYMQCIEYTGLFSAEFLYSKGEYYFLEINLRNDGTSWLSTCSGYNLPDMVCRSFMGEKVVEVEGTFKPMHYMNIMADIHYVRWKEIGFFKWIKQFNKNTCYSHYNKKDRRPFLNYLTDILKGHVR